MELDQESARRVPWKGIRTVEDPRDAIVDAASRCLVAYGLERTSIAAVAREAGVSRQTIYNHFTTRDEIVGVAIERAATAASERIIDEALTNTTAAGFVVDLCIAAIDEFRRNPAISPMLLLLDHADARRQVLTADVLSRTRRLLQPIVSYAPERVDYLGEMTETFVRIQLSLLMIDSDTTRSVDPLRGYLHRVLVPALGLNADPTFA